MTELGRNFEIEYLPDGSIQHTFYQKPIAYKENSIWKRIVNNWVDSGITERPHIVTKAPMMVSVANDGMRRIHPTRETGRYAEVGPPYVKMGGVWQKVAFSGASRQGNRITWSRVQADLLITMGGHFIKLDIELKGGYVPPDGQFAFPVGLTGLTRDGGTILADGMPVMLLRKPAVYDADNPEDVRQIAHDFVQVASQWYILFTLPDLAGMARPVVDPTLTLQPDGTDGIDARIQTYAPDANYGTTYNVDVGEESGIANIARALIEFNLSSLPAAAVISSATFSLYAYADWSTNARTFRVYRQKRTWVELEATWNIYSTGNSWATAGGFGADDCEQTDIGSRDFTATETLNEFKVFTLTPTTKAGLDLGNGWLVKADAESDDMYQFSSSDHATAAQRPKLVIIYTVPSDQPMRHRIGRTTIMATPMRGPF